MELPHIGKNCALRECNQLDFLPIKCDSCSEVFCIQHYKYDAHNCEKAKQKDVQVPVCPLCSQPVASKRDQLPDIAVSQHIDQYCTRNDLLPSSSRKKPPSSLQACTFKSCKQKDLIYLECSDCRSKYCIKHRHPSDHSCSGPPTVAANLANNWNQFKGSCSSSASNNYELIKNKVHQISRSGQAALNRLTLNKTSGGNSTTVQSLQGGLSEQEALAIAMNESRSTSRRTPGDGTSFLPGHEDDNDEDAALARALHESQLEASRRQRAATNQKDNCVLS